MVLSSSQQLVVAFTAVLFVVVVFPRLFSAGIGSRESRIHEPRFSRRGPGPGTARPHQFIQGDDPSAQNYDNMQQVRKMMEQEMKSDKYKSNSNKGYVFTLMPLYAVGVGLFAAYKFMKIRSKDVSQAETEKAVKGAKKSAETENQLNELEQRLSQTERMLNSILTQLDPLTNCVKSVAADQKNEIMSQLQSIRQLMKKRGMDCPIIDSDDSMYKRNLDDLIESLAAQESHPKNAPNHGEERGGNKGEKPESPECVPVEEGENGADEEEDVTCSTEDKRAVEITSRGMELRKRNRLE